MMSSTNLHRTGTIALLAACVSSSAHGQSHTTIMGMPEGSRDVTVSLAAVSTPRDEGGRERTRFVVPLIAVQWANGVFIDMNLLGIHLSDQPGLQYGPAVRPVRIARSTVAGGARISRSRLAIERGGFLNYVIAHGVGLYARVMQGGSYDGRGLTGTFGTLLSVPLAPHHGIGMFTQMTVSNRSSLQESFGVTAQQAALEGLAEHGVAAGVRNLNTTLFWRWELSRTYSLTTQMEYQTLRGSAAASPRVERAGALTALAMLSYRF